MNNYKAWSLVALGLVSGNADALILEVTASGDIYQFRDTTNLFGFGVSEWDDHSPLIGRRAELRFLVDLEEDCSSGTCYKREYMTEGNFNITSLTARIRPVRIPEPQETMPLLLLALTGSLIARRRAKR